ncbi:hypothetical protein F4X33_21580, partial [Candidatus Poribacteria bacterium]|nr:hypothetical protein [Candidatus Poribacteria bacterium]
MKAWQGLGGETDTIVEFDYDGVTPSDSLTSLSIPTRHPISIEAIDVNGNTRHYSFNLESDSPESYIVDDPFSLYARLNLEGRSLTSVLAERPDLRRRVGLGLDSENIRDLVEIVSALSGMPNLKRLNLDYNLISDFSPIASLTNLTELRLKGNNISDLSPLSGLTNLTELELDANNISDLSPIASLTNLTELDLSGNNISDLSPLSGLTKLTKLNLSGNSISDLSPIAGLTNLTELFLDRNNISDLSAVSGLNRLIGLDLSDNSISDISALAGLPRLRGLDVRANPLNYTSIYTYIPALQAPGVQVDFNPHTPTRLLKVSGDQHIAPGASLPIVVEVRGRGGGTFEGVPVTFTLTSGSGTLSTTATTTDRNGRAESTLTLGADLGTHTVEVSAAEIEQPVTFTIVGREGVIIIPDSNLRAKIGDALGKASADRISPSEIATLTYLNVSNAGIVNLTGLEHATNLTKLYLYRNNISDISAVSGLTKLTELALRGNNISDISAVSGLLNLTELRLGGNNISDISAVSGLLNLTLLWLGGNNISDLSVSGLTNLTELNLSYNSISDLSVSGLTNLTELNLSFNNISDLSGLAGLTNLAELNLSANKISYLSGLAGLTNLTRLSLYSNNISDLSGLAGLTNLTWLFLSSNNILDLSPLVADTGLQSGATVDVRYNPLIYTSIHTHIPTLQSRGIEVRFDDQAQPALLKISGDNQTGAAGAALANPFVVEMQSADGTRVAGILVAYVVTAGDGTLSTTYTRTDANGRAESTLTLGPNLGTHTVSASLPTIPARLRPGRVARKFQRQVTFYAIADTLPTEFLWSIPAGVSLIHVPLQVTTVDGVPGTITSISDLYDTLGGAGAVNLLITYDATTQAWHSYLGDISRGTAADRRLTDDIG